MNPCLELIRWITENVLVPVERAFTEAREACADVGSWVEHEVWQPLERWMSEQERRCTQQPCNWWCLCCNKWFCWILMIIVRVVTWIVITVLKWVVEIVCEVVTVVVGLIVELILKVITRVLSFVVCLFTDPGQAFKSLWDLWNDIVDAVGDVLDLIGTLLDDVIGIVNDAARLVDGLGRTFCILGTGLCTLASAIFGFVSGILRWATDIVDQVRDVVTGVKDLVTGLLTFNWCKIQGGLGIASGLRLIGSGTRIPAGWFYSGPAALMNQAKLERTIVSALSEAFANDPERLARSIARACIGGTPIGVPIRILPARMAIRSSTFLQRMAQERVLDLHAIAGRISDCNGKFVHDAFAGEVVYTGTSTTVTQSDLDTFVARGPDAVASFTVYPIKTDLFRRYLEMARRKGFMIGLNFTWPGLRELVVDDNRFVPLQADDENAEGRRGQQPLFEMMGRPTSGENMSEVPVVAHFGYRDAGLTGLTSAFRPPLAPSPTGTTFRVRFPELVYRFLPIHEIGHYFGLQHEGHLSPRYIMWRIDMGIEWGDTIAEFAFLTGEAIFSEQDAIDAWRWITTTPEFRDAILP